MDRVLADKDVDRLPIAVWQSLGHPRMTAAEHAELTLAFGRRLDLDLLKVMNEYEFPKPAGGLLAVREDANPFPEQVHALELIRDGLGDRTYFIDTLPNPWHIAESLSSRAEVFRLKDEQPQKLLDALEQIARSEANHELRLAKGFSQEALADMAGVHRTYMGSVERGERNISLENIVRIARALKVSPGSLLQTL
jgi:DNA-binding XRE family transcriptional regulator